MNNEPLVSVIIPIFNQEKYIDESIMSILEQTYAKIKIILVNDCSTDNTPKIINKYKKIDKRVKVIARDKNGGVSKARNAGIRNATGELYAFMDPDDIAERNFIERLVKAVRNRDMAVCGYSEMFKNGFHEKRATRKQITLNAREFIDKIFKPEGCKGFVWNKILKKEIIDKYNIRFDETKTVLEDMDFVIRYASKAKKIKIIPDILYYYRMRKTSATNTIIGKQKIIDA